MELAARGAKVYMACRDLKKCDEARLDIISKTANNEVFARKLDLGSQDSIREFVRKYLGTDKVLIYLYSFINVLFLNFNKVSKMKSRDWIFSSITLA